MFESLEINNPFQGIHDGLNKESGKKYLQVFMQMNPLLDWWVASIAIPTSLM
jgi:hypothetical protein